MTETRDTIVRRIFEEGIPSWWSQDGNTYNLIYSFSKELKRLYDNLDYLDLDMFVNTSTGSKLDDLGKLFRLARNDGETDVQYRARIKAYWAAFTAGGTNEGIIKAVSLMSGIDEDDIEVEEQTSYQDLFIIDDTYVTTTWAAENDGTNLTQDTSVWYKGRNSLNFDGNTGVDVGIVKTFGTALDFSAYNNNYLGYYAYLPTTTDFTRIETKIEDSSGNYETFYSSNLTEVGFHEISIDLTETPDDSSGTLDWTNVKKIHVNFKFSSNNNSTDFRVNYLTFKDSAYNMRIKVNIDIDETFNLELLNIVGDVVNNSKAAGIYFNEDNDIILESKGGIFLVNLSDVNGNDKYL